MRKTLFVMTHLGSGPDLFDILSSHPNIEGFRTGWIYDHPEKLLSLTELPHKQENAHAVYMDEILHNYSWSCKSLLPHCRLVAYIREPTQSLSLITQEHGYSPDRAARHYCYRLRGICEYMIRNPSPILTWDDLDEGSIRDLGEHLGLRTALKWKQPERVRAFPDEALLADCHKAYDYYLSVMRSVSLCRS